MTTRVRARKDRRQGSDARSGAGGHKGWAAPETERAYLRAERLADTGATIEQQFALLVGLFGLPYVGGNLSAARERLKQVWKFVDRHPDPVFILEAVHHDWSVALSAGELETSQRHVERGLELFESKLRSAAIPLYSAHHPAVCGYAWHARLSWLRGRPDAARRYADRTISVAKELGDTISAAFALSEKALVHRMMLESKLALEIAGGAINIAEDVGFLYVLRHSRIIKGWALTELGRTEEGVGQIREETDALSANREELFLTLGLGDSRRCVPESRTHRGRFEGDSRSPGPGPSQRRMFLGGGDSSNPRRVVPGSEPLRSHLGKSLIGTSARDCAPAGCKIPGVGCGLQPGATAAQYRSA